MDTGKLKTFRPDVVQLESREVPTVASITFANHILTVTTTNQDTNLVVQQDVNAVYIRDSVTGQVSTYNRAQFPIARVDVIGGDGNDTFMAVGNAGVSSDSWARAETTTSKVTRATTSLPEVQGTTVSMGGAATTPV
jgi:hypothetical protein